MKKTALLLLAAVVMLFAFAAYAVAAEGGEKTEKDSSVQAMAAIAGAIAISVAAFGTGIAQGFGLGKACEGTARNPGASGKIMVIMIIGLAMIESLCIYAFLVSLGILSSQGLFF